MLHLRCGREVLFHFFDGFRELHTGAENDAIRLLEELLPSGGDAISGKSDAVQLRRGPAIAICDDIRQTSCTILDMPPTIAQAPILTNW